MQLNTLSLYEPEVKETANILYLKDDQERDWYEAQDSFDTEKLKVAYTADGIIRSADYDVSALWPINMAVAEVSPGNVPDGFNINGEWMYDGKKIIPVPVDYVARAETNRKTLLQLASQAIAPLQDASELGIATRAETEALERWKHYRVTLIRLDTSAAPDIQWPEQP